MAQKQILIFVAILLAACHPADPPAQEPPIWGSAPNLNPNTTQHTSEWCEGWQAGWQEAATQVWHNRNSNRALHGQPPETQPEATARIHERSPALPPGQTTQPDSPIARTINIMLDSIDLYVVLHVDQPQEPKTKAEGCK